MPTRPRLSVPPGSPDMPTRPRLSVPPGSPDMPTRPRLSVPPGSPDMPTRPDGVPPPRRHPIGTGVGCRGCDEEILAQYWPFTGEIRTESTNGLDHHESSRALNRLPSRVRPADGTAEGPPR